MARTTRRPVAAIEEDLLGCLLRSDGQACSKEELLAAAGLAKTDGGPLASYIKRLRPKLKARGGTIVNIRGQGYRYEVDDKGQESIVRLRGTYQSIKESPGNSIGATLARAALEQTADFLEDLQRGRMSVDRSPQSKVNRLFAKMLEAMGDRDLIVATSCVKPMWWLTENPDWWERNRMAIERGVLMARIFILHDGEFESSTGSARPTKDVQRIMRRQEGMGINVSWVLRAAVVAKNVEVKDFWLLKPDVVNLYHPTNKSKMVTGGILAADHKLVGLGADHTQVAQEFPGERLDSEGLEVYLHPEEVNTWAERANEVLRMSSRYEDDEWFRTFFQRDYEDIASHTAGRSHAETDDSATPSETRAEVESILKMLEDHGYPPHSGASVLDVGCGTGRIVAPLTQQGYHVKAIDYSPALIEKATRRCHDAEFRVQDMRGLRDKGRFDVVLSVYTSFGYFEGPAPRVAPGADARDQNEDVLRRMALALKKGGLLILDLDDLDWFRQEAAERQEDTDWRSSVDDVTKEVRIHRWDAYDEERKRRLSQYVVQERPKASQHPVITRFKPLVSVQLYDCKDLEEMFTKYGLRVVDKFGKLSTLEGHVPGSSERLVLLLQKES